MAKHDPRLIALGDRFPAELVNAGAHPELRYHLFHAPNSVCSQKVRTVLFEAGRPFFSHIVDVFAGESYDPLYVKMRAEACIESGWSFAARHTGSTSVVETGCDACVVPTLVDDDTGKVQVDSLNICLTLADRFGGALRPAEFAEAIDREIEIVDSLPNYPLLAAHADDPLLATAYTAKRDKEGNFGLFSADSIAASERRMQAAFDELACRLLQGSAFLFGDRVSLADFFWAIELVRTQDIGYGSWIEGSPRLREYYGALSAVPSIHAAIIERPGARIKLPPRP